MKKNRYLKLRAAILLRLVFSGKLTARKLFNALCCYLAHWTRMKKSGRYPFAVNFELWNECNANCLFCRDASGGIYDRNPAGAAPIPKGKMPLEVFTALIDEMKGHILMAILYVNGEPLMYKDIYKAIRYASDKRVATMISTNGILMNKKSSEMLIGSGLDFLKVAIAGFSQDTYGRQNRHGSVETVKENLRNLSILGKRASARPLVMIDFMLYDYNMHEQGEMRKFCRECGFALNLRPGNIKGLNAVGPLIEKKRRALRSGALCDSMWKIMTVNWNGDILPCCDYVVWSGARGYGRFEAGKTAVSALWNGRSAVENRLMHIRRGRKSIPVCAKCTRQGIHFAY